MISRVCWPAMAAAVAALFSLPAATFAVEDCPECFAVFVMPDTQDYSNEPGGGAHLSAVTQWICDNRASFEEPATNAHPAKQMPILMVIQLGDLVDWASDSDGDDGIFQKWIRISAAFDNLDDCGSGPVPYLVVPGNHDYQTDVYRFLYQKRSDGFFQYFGEDRWAPYRCSSTTSCDFAAGEYFLGGGDPIPAFSREYDGDGDPGPPVDLPGRHRAGVVRTPNGQPFLFLGLELAFDYPPAEFSSHVDSSAWPLDLLADYTGIPTIVFHHDMLDPDPDGIQGSGDTKVKMRWGSDSMDMSVWDLFVEPTPHALMTFNGHFWLSDREENWIWSTTSGVDVFSVFRNYQAWNGYGDGWNVIAVFDPDAHQIRVRSYRIADVDANGNVISTGIQEKDFGLPEKIFAYPFPDARPESLDNCPRVSNPGQEDADGDGLGDRCDFDECNDGVDNDGDGLVDFSADPECSSVEDPWEGPGAGPEISPLVASTRLLLLP